MQPEELQKELSRCLGCKPKPCSKGCPLGVSPQEFIACAKEGNWQEAAARISARNPLPQTCGLICPDYFCQKSCIRSKLDKPLSIPCLQATVIRKGGLPPLTLPPAVNKHAAVIGGGPSGLGAVFELIQNGWHVTLFEKSAKLGGAARLIPEYRLPKAVLEAEISRLVENERVSVKYKSEVTDFEALKQQYDGVILALGEQTPRTLGVNGEEHCLPYAEFLADTSALESRAPLSHTRVAVLGGGEVALDCALSAKKSGCQEVTMFVRRRRADMKIMQKDHQELDEKKITVQELTSVTEITKHPEGYRLQTIKNRINDEGRAEHIADTISLVDFDIVIMALGSYCPQKDLPEGVKTTGDMTGRCGTVVQALADGRAVARELIEAKETNE